MYRGPGSYNYQKYTDQKRGGSAFGKQNRDVFNQKSITPGPGSYNASNNPVKKNGYSFPKNKRTEKPAQSTVGYHTIPSSVPDVPKYLISGKVKS